MHSFCELIVLITSLLTLPLPTVTTCGYVVSFCCDTLQCQTGRWCWTLTQQPLSVLCVDFFLLTVLPCITIKHSLFLLWTQSTWSILDLSTTRVQRVSGRPHHLVFVRAFFYIRQAVNKLRSELADSKTLIATKPPPTSTRTRYLPTPVNAAHVALINWSSGHYVVLVKSHRDLLSCA